jgi:hypothetical protein
MAGARKMPSAGLSLETNNDLKETNDCVTE